MALTISELGRGHMGAMKTVLCTVTFDSSYPTGGEAFGPSDVSLSTILAVIPAAAASTDEGLAITWDSANEKLLAHETGATVDTPLDEVDDTDDLSAFSATVLVVGH